MVSIVPSVFQPPRRGNPPNRSGTNRSTGREGELIDQCSRFTAVDHDLDIASRKRVAPSTVAPQVRTADNPWSCYLIVTRAVAETPPTIGSPAAIARPSAGTAKLTVAVHVPSGSVERTGVRALRSHDD